MESSKRECKKGEIPAGIPPAAAEEARYKALFLDLLRKTPVPDSFLSPEERDQGITHRDPLAGL